MNPATASNPNNFDHHAKKWAEIYKKKYQPLYEEFAKKLHDYLVYQLNEIRKANVEFKYHTIEGREKKVEKFRKKASQPDKLDPERLRYPEPLGKNVKHAITDLAGSRIIAFYLNDLKLIDEFINQRFNVVEIVNKFKDLEDAEKFGYQGIHYIVQVNESTYITGKEKFEDLFAEIQIKTILEHSWAEMEHDFYDIRKYGDQSDPVNREIKRRFHSLAGLLELADREFQSLRDLKKNKN